MCSIYNVARFGELDEVNGLLSLADVDHEYTAQLVHAALINVIERLEIANTVIDSLRNELVALQHPNNVGDKEG